MSEATVVFLFMGEGFNRVIRPMLWKQLPSGPGSCPTTSRWAIGSRTDGTRRDSGRTYVSISGRSLRPSSRRQSGPTSRGRPSSSSRTNRYGDVVSACAGRRNRKRFRPRSLRTDPGRGGVERRGEEALRRGPGSGRGRGRMSTCHHRPVRSKEKSSRLFPATRGCPPPSVEMLGTGIRLRESLQRRPRRSRIGGEEGQEAGCVG